MTQFDAIVRYNQTLYRAGKVERLVENSDWEPVSRFFAEVRTEGKDILDVGCATGSIAMLAAKGYGRWQSYEGIDLCTEYVDAFNRRGIPRAKAEIGNAINLSAKNDSSKNIVICLFILQHLSEDDGRKALRELKRVAKPDADVLIGLTVNAERVESGKDYAPEEALKAGAERVLTLIWNKRRLVEALEQEGFKILRPEEIPGRRPYVKLYIRARASKSDGVQATGASRRAWVPPVRDTTP